MQDFQPRIPTDYTNFKKKISEIRENSWLNFCSVSKMRKS